MYASKAFKAPVTVGADKGSLRLILSRSLFSDGKQRFIPLGLSDSDVNRTIADSYAARVIADVALKKFDESLETYKGFKAEIREKVLGKPTLAVLPTPKKEEAYTIGKLWEDWCEKKEPDLEVTTFKSKYLGSFSSMLKGVAHLQITPTVGGEVKKHLLAISKNTQLITGLLKQLEQAIVHANNVEKINLSKNPFHGLSEKKKKKKELDFRTEVSLENKRTAFTEVERDIILDAFKSAKKVNIRMYYPLIFFMFYTGCRPGEAIELQWCDINFEKNVVMIRRSYNSRYKVQKGTKNDTSRWFQMSPKLRQFLEELKPKEVAMSAPVFPNWKGKLHCQGALFRIWGVETTVIGRTGKRYDLIGIVKKLYQDGKIGVYLPPYKCRHTFINLALEKGIPKDVLAAQCGHSEEVQGEHYVDKSYAKTFVIEL